MRKTAYWSGFLFSAFFGAAVFFFLFGTEFLNPAFYLWMQKADACTHFCGFNFFNQEPWHWSSPGKILNFNAPNGTSLVYTDSVPLVGEFLKFFHFPLPYQYHGGWILLCFVLQAALGFVFCAAASESIALGAMGSVFFATLPAFLFRTFQTTRHYSLLAHFLIFIPILFLFQPKSRSKIKQWHWFLLLALALGVHFYLFVYALAFYFASEFKQFSDIRFQKKYIGGALGLVLVAWLYGYFVIPPGNSLSFGFGDFSMNLFSWVNSEGFSKFAPALPLVNAFEREGYQYLGLGLIAWVLGLGVQRQFRAKLKMDYELLRGSTLLWLLLFLTALSLSIRIGIFSWVLPDWITAPVYLALFAWFYEKQMKKPRTKAILLSVITLAIYLVVGKMLRSSGRTGWVLTYLLLYYLFSLRPKRIWVAAALLLQLIDVYPILKSVQAENQSLVRLQVPKIEEQENWKPWLSGVQRILLIQSKDIDQPRLNLYAVRTGTPIGPIAVARNAKTTERTIEKTWKEELESGQPQEKTLYIVGDDIFWAVLRQKPGIEKRVTLGEVDGYRLVRSKFHP